MSTMTQPHTMALGPDRRSRVLLIVSLALNLFFIGGAGAFAVHDYLFARGVDAPRGPASRIDRLAATLPPADGEILRAEYAARASTVDAAREKFRQAQDGVRAALRTEPFSPGAMRSAFVANRPNRLAFDEALQDLLVSAATKMSPAGRAKLAEWPPADRPPPPRR